MAEERKSYNTTLRIDLTRRLRILSAQQGKRQNDLLEEAIQDLLKKYEKEPVVTEKGLVSKHEKREHPRVETSWPVNVLSSRGSFTGKLKNISKGGALINCAELPNGDETFELFIEIPDHTLNISAKVEKVRLNLDDSDSAATSYDMAVRFLGIDVDQRRQLFKAIEQQN